MSLLEISNLSKSFKDMIAVNGLSLSIGEREVHGILGPNGAGKSTTINCLLGLVPFDSGTVAGCDKMYKKGEEKMYKSGEGRRCYDIILPGANCPGGGHERSALDGNQIRPSEGAELYGA